LPKAGRARGVASIEGFITRPTGTGPETLKLRPWQYEMINGLFDAPTDCVTKISDSLLARS